MKTVSASADVVVVLGALIFLSIPKDVTARCGELKGETSTGRSLKTSPACNGFVIAYGKNYDGGDLGRGIWATSAEECCEKCTNYVPDASGQKCTAWTYGRPEWRDPVTGAPAPCWLKGRGYADPPIDKNDGAISGKLQNAPATGCNGFTVTQGLNYVGGDIKPVWASSAQECCAQCANYVPPTPSAQKCTAWVYGRSDWRDPATGAPAPCWLKGSGYADPPLNLNDGATSGKLISTANVDEDQVPTEAFVGSIKVGTIPGSSPVAANINGLLSLAGGADDVQKYNEYVTKLRADPAAAVAAISDAYKKLDPVLDYTRSALMYYLYESLSVPTYQPYRMDGATHVKAQDFVQYALSQPLPNVTYVGADAADVDANDVELSRLTGEEAARAAAVRALGELASAENTYGMPSGLRVSSEQLLLSLLNSPLDSVKLEAIRAYQNAGDDYNNRTEYLASILPPSDQFFLEMDHPNDGNWTLQADSEEAALRANATKARNATAAAAAAPEVVPLSKSSRRKLLGSCSYQPGNTDETLDAALLPKMCVESTITKLWRDFTFKKKYWDDGFGWEAACDIVRPLARTFNSLYFLKFAQDSGYGELSYMYSYAARNTDELHGRCGSGNYNSGAYAMTTWGFWVDDRTEVYWPFFYGLNAVGRAATIVHEARHYGARKEHNAGSSCPRKTSCDSSWAYNGANTWQVRWLRDVAYNCNYFTAQMRFFAKVRANQVLAGGFRSTPNWRVEDICSR